LTLPPVVPLDVLLPVPLEVELLDEDPLDDEVVEPLDDAPLEVEPLDEPPVPEEDEVATPPVPWPPLASLYLPKS
jgi:hypothetical protein